MAMTEQQRAALSKQRGKLAAELPMTPQQRRDYISAQGRAESNERLSGASRYSPYNPQSVRRYTVLGATQALERKRRRGKRSR